MWFVIWELMVPLLLALLLGLALGWLMWRWRHRQVTSLEWDSVLSESSARHIRIMELEDLIGGREREVVSLQVEAPDVTPGQSDQPSSTSEAGQGTSANQSDLERALAAAQKRIAELEARTGEKDDLKLIKGVGPKLEQILHNAGITSFAHLAGLDEAGVEALQEQLVQFPGRVEREDWVGQARELMNR